MGRDDEQASAEQLVAQVEQLQRIQPVTALRGHDVCADIHTVLDVAQTLLVSRDRRAFAGPASESTDDLLRELRAMGLDQATPQLVAMIALRATELPAAGPRAGRTPRVRRLR